METEKLTSSLITGGRDCKLRLWNSSTFEQVAEANDHKGWIFTIIGVDEFRVASSGYDETIQVYELPGSTDTLYDDMSSESISSEEEDEGEDTEEEETIQFPKMKSIMSLEGHENCVRCLASFPQHQTLVAGDDDSKIKIWNLKKKKCARTIKKMHRDSVKDIQATGKNNFVSGSDDRTVLKWSLKRLRKPVRSISLNSIVTKLLFLKEKDVLAVGMSNIIGLLDKNLKICNQIVNDSHLTDLCYDLESNILISGDRKGMVTMWDLRNTNKVLFSNQSHDDYVTGIAILNQQEYLTTSLQRPKSMKYWSFNKKICKKKVSVDCDGIWSMCHIGEKSKKEMSEQMKIDITERINWLREESDVEEEILTKKVKLQLFDRHLILSKVFLLLGDVKVSKFM